MWGTEVSQRFAIPLGVNDSLLVYDGHSWDLVGLRGETAEGVATYSDGASFSDGATVVVGEVCDNTCSPVLLKQDRFGGRWSEVMLDVGLGIPGRQDQSTCAGRRFTWGQGELGLGRTRQGVHGVSGDDYYVWGSWGVCTNAIERGPNRTCPVGHPCTWHVLDGVPHPVRELLGLSVVRMAVVDDTYYALGADGSVWRRVEGSWRHVAGLPFARITRVAATRDGHVSSAFPDGSPSRLDWSDRTGTYRTPPVPGASDSTSVTQIVVTDDALAVLTSEGLAYLAQCAVSGGEQTQTGESRLDCHAWERINSQGDIFSDLASFPDGTLIGLEAVGKVTVRSGAVTRVERLPDVAREDTL